MENSFETKMKRLEELTALLETNSLTIDENIKYYEEAQGLIKELESILKGAKSKIEEISNKSDEK